LKNCRIDISPEAAATVVIVSGGYPGDYAKGKIITGLSAVAGSLVFHAGTRQSSNGILSDGGRVLAVTGQGSTLEMARQAAYRSLTAISFEGAYFRRDIGVDLLVTGNS
jgi:phosphoribosylamine--glycine ligase